VQRKKLPLLTMPSSCLFRFLYPCKPVYPKGKNNGDVFSRTRNGQKYSECGTLCRRFESSRMYAS
ncbi:MAG: hypothetical protein LKK36_17785, partial [Ewingella americana]|uniref:hypothetical protein n=1 Tax=Ewingella americana TaxID=41202 RepID=UPI0024304C7E